MRSLRGRLNSLINNGVEYYLRNYKKMVFIPLVFIIFFAGVIALHYYQHGSPVNPDISLAGGISLVLNTNHSMPVSVITSNLSAALKTEISVSILHPQFSNAIAGYTITAGKSVNSTQLSNAVSKLFGIKLTSKNSSVTFVSAALAQSAIYDSILLLGIAFLLVAMVSIFYFRNPVQAFSNVISIVSDIINVVGVIDILGLGFSTASIAGILMIMGYSADRNIILATNILKREEASMKYRLVHTIKTSLTMDAAALVTFIILFVGTTNPVIQSIAIILIIGVIFDDFAVWILNGSVQLAGTGYKAEPKPAAQTAEANNGH